MITFISPKDLYTQEIFVYEHGVDEADISRPISVVRDPTVHLLSPMEIIEQKGQ